MYIDITSSITMMTMTLRTVYLQLELLSELLNGVEETN